MTAFALKIIASLCMLIDHVGAVFPLSPAPGLWFRRIGRVAFPIYAYLIAQGCRHTKNLNRYLLRLGLFALISEIPFDLAFGAFRSSAGSGFRVDFLDQTNVFYTLFLGVACIAVYERLRANRRVWSVVPALLIAPATFGAALLLRDAVTPDFTVSVGLLAYAAAALWLSDRAAKREAARTLAPPEPPRHIAPLLQPGRIAALALTVPILLLGHVLNTDYGMYGIAYILFFHFMKPENRVTRTVAVAVVAFVEYGYSYFYHRLLELGVAWPQLPGVYMWDFPDGLAWFLFALAAACPVFLYSGRQGRKMKWAFYVFYPAHLAALAAIYFCLLLRPVGYAI